MNLGEKIKKYYQEAELYCEHGLMSEALDKYKAVEALIKSSGSIRNRAGLLQKVGAKIEETAKTLQRLDRIKPPAAVTAEAQSLMKEMYTFDDPEAKGSAALGGAIALAKFGQYDKAIEELTPLLAYDKLRLEAAKNILWCWMQQNYADYAISLYQKWRKQNLFPEKETQNIHQYFIQLMDDAGVHHEFDQLESQRTIEPDSEVNDDDILDINSIRFVLPRGAREGEQIELEVSFQSGKYIRMILPRREKDLIDGVHPGDFLKDIIFYSPVAIFSGEGYVSSRSEITAGPKRGDYSLEIKIIKIVS